MKLARKGVLLSIVVLLVLLVAAGAALAAKPTKVVIITMDQMKPWYASTYDMENVLWLQSHGANFKNATVGQMASETVVSHNTIVSGQLPKHMGWTDEVMRDTGNVLGYGAGAIVTVGDLTYDQFALLVEAEGYPKLGDYMHAKFPGKIVANFGGKYYQVASTAASSSDMWVTYGSKKNVDVAWGLPWEGKYRGPSGGNVPAYIADDNRFKISTGNNPTPAEMPTPATPLNDYYRTDVDKPAYLYAEDGRMVPGPYDTNLGGDDWVADAAIKVIEHEDWSAMHLNFSGIDKIGHMWGGGNVDKPATYGWDPETIMAQVHMPWIAKNADDQVGKLIQALKANGDWNSTLFVVLADHGSTWAKNAHYVDAAGGGNLSWYYDPNKTCANTSYGQPSADPTKVTNNEAVLHPLNATGNLAYSYQSTAIEAWLIDRSWAKKAEAAAAVQGLPDVIATYVRWGDRFMLTSTGKMTKSERAWWRSHGQKLVNTMASSNGPDVVGLLKDQTGYGVYGDHGGAQKEVQRVPMVMYAKGMKHMDSGAPFHLVDVLPTVLRNMGIRQMAPMDGKAYNLPL